MSLCNGNPPTGSTLLPYTMCGDPESGSDHFLKEVSDTSFGTGYTHGTSRVNATSSFLFSSVYIYN